MPPHQNQTPGRPDTVFDVLSPREVAKAAGMTERAIRQLIIAAAIPTVDGEMVTLPDAVTAVADIRAGRYRAGRAGQIPGVFGSALLSRGVPAATRHVPTLVSAGLHLTVAALFVGLTTVSLTTASEPITNDATMLARLVFVADPGPGGGGGGGGLRMPTPPPPATRTGTRQPRSPAPDRAEPRRVEAAPTPPRAPLENEPLQVLSPIVPVGADERTRRGLLADLAAERTVSQGPGEGGGVGTGGGAGVGEGRGRGIGPGSGGGMGGGPYRPGAGIVPPRLLYEVKPTYTEEARRRGIEGSVLLELVVTDRGAVDHVRVLRGLGHGLDEAALVAVRQWRFEPADRRGTPVDVLVEVVVEFRLR